MIDGCNDVAACDQVIPRLLRQQTQNEEKASNLYAYISVEDITGISNPRKVLRGQVLRCNLTKSLLISAVKFAEVRSTLINDLLCA